MSTSEPGGRDHVPTSTIVQCDHCEAYVSLLVDGVMRKHLDPSKQPPLPRTERICPNSNTDLYRIPQR